MDKKEQRIEITIERKEVGFKTTVNVYADSDMVMMALAKAVARILVNTKNNPLKFSEYLITEYHIFAKLREMVQKGRTMKELRILQEQMLDAFARGWRRRAETLRRQIIAYLKELNDDPVDPVISRVDFKQEEENERNCFKAN